MSPSVRSLFIGLLMAVLAGASHAAPSLPWTPGPMTRHALELLADEAGLDLPLTQWPLPRAAVRRALDALPAELPAPLDAAREQVRRDLRAAEGSELSLTLRGRDDALAGFGDESTPGSSIKLRSSTLATPHAALQVGGRIDTDLQAGGHAGQFRLDDSALATEAWGVQLQAWSHRAWWSPGWQSSLLLGNNAPPFNGIGLQRASASRSESRWLSWLGPWNYDFFIAQSDDAIHSWFVGTRLTLRPFSLLEIGLTRTAQWGGRGRPQSVKSFLRMLVGAGVNADRPEQAASDPANEMSGFDVRLRCAFGLRCALYTQLIGEDQAGIMPSRFLGLYGVESWTADGRQRFFAEFAETLCGAPLARSPVRHCAYRNHAYPDGYVHAGRWIGAGAGPDSRLLTLGWLDADSDTSLRLHSGRVGSRIGRFSAVDDDPLHSGRVVGVAARQGWSWGPATVSAEFDWLRVKAPEGNQREARLGVNLRMGLDDAARTTGAGLGASLSTAGSSVTPLLTGAALVAGAALLDRPLDDHARAHGSNPSAKAIRRTGDALPFVGFGLAGLSWAMQHGSVQGDVAFSSMAAGVSAVAIAELTKLAVDRARPSAELGPASFGDNRRRSDSSFPSIHATLAWSVVTPYAKHYDMPWLYGVAALTNATRVMGRDHWFSDTVGGAALGYVVADRIYRDRVGSDSDKARLSIGPRSIALNVPFD